MAYADKVTAVAVTVVLFLAVAISPRCTEAQAPEMDPICAISIPEIVKHCYAAAAMGVLPSEKCCNDLKTASKREVTCLCDNFFAHPHPVYVNITKAYYSQVNTACGVVDKYQCNGAYGGATKKIAISLVMTLVASLFF